MLTHIAVRFLCCWSVGLGLGLGLGLSVTKRLKVRVGVSRVRITLELQLRRSRAFYVVDLEPAVISYLITLRSAAVLLEAAVPMRHRRTTFICFSCL